jgi:nucleoside-diphosphate-sugar epimerase
MPKEELALVTGGTGYFGSILVRKLIEQNMRVRVLDLNCPANPDPSVEYIKGDIRDLDVCLTATQGVSYVFHNVAQVPLANDSRLINEVNIDGTKNICNASKQNHVKQFVYTSSSAVYGIPTKLPIQINDPKRPVEDYGRAKLAGEAICHELSQFGIQVKIIRPRTILGLGRVGIFGILFDWVRDGINIYTLGDGSSPYQFIHAEDLANGVIKAAQLDGNFEFNLGALDYESFRADLQSLCNYSKTGSRVVGLNDWLVRPTIKLMSFLKLLPFASYQLQLYSMPVYFDCERDWQILGYTPKFSNSEMLIESYKHFIENLSEFEHTNLSNHQKTPKSFSLSIVKRFLMAITTIQNLKKGFS